MKFDSKEVDKAAENDGFALLPDGEYDAEIIECEETVSKNGDPMFKVTLSIPDPTGSFSHKVWDYISPRWFQRKFKSFFDSMGKAEMYQTGNIDPALLLHQFVTAKIKTEKQEGYADKNSVDMYVLAEVNAAKKMASPSAEAAKDDGLPF